MVSVAQIGYVQYLVDCLAIAAGASAMPNAKVYVHNHTTTCEVIPFNF
jgi:hypothetical protein